MKNGHVELPALAYIFRSPHSYTRQDVVEFHIPGCDFAASALCDELIASGAREATAGEFTARAMLSGRIDLSQAQAVADIINASDEAHRRAAIASLGGAVNRLSRNGSEKITEILATVEASIDLADEDVQLESPTSLAEKLENIAAKLTDTAQKAIDVPDQAVTPRVVLAGRANVGKSSLLNTLCNTDRAIVSALAGTTRDVLSATLSLAGHPCPVTIQDAAGLCAIDDEIAGRADSAARAAVRAADIVLFVFDLNRNLNQADADLLDDVRSMNRSGVILLVGNKCDLADELAITDRLGEIERRINMQVRATSAITNTGIDELKTTLVKMLGCPAETSDSAVGLHLRQKRLLLSAADACSRAKDICQGAGDISIAPETTAIELRWALSQLGQISGEVLTEDILGNIFQRFCVGK